MVLALHTQMDNVDPSILSSPLESVHDQMISHEACHHRHWTIHTVGKRRVWKARVSLGQHTRLDGVEHGMP